MLTHGLRADLVAVRTSCGVRVWRLGSAGRGQMRFSKFFDLGKRQPELDFVDIDVSGDIPLFIDPFALEQLENDDWATECVSLIQDFFDVVLSAIKSDKNEEARALLSSLREPNETHLGLSRGKAKGHALGNSLAADIWKAL